MLSFTSFLVEKKVAEKSWNINDAKGKLYEILLGSHFHHGTHKTGKPNDFLTHYRDEEGKSPKEIHDYIKKELNDRHPGMYDTINKHAIEGAKHVKSHLAKHGHNEAHETVWTSQKGDHKKFTGKDDPNSDADLMVRTEHGPIGLSLKYGESKDMNLRNPGIDSLERGAGLKKGALSDLRNAHYNKVKKEYGIKDHAHYKQLKNDPRAKKIVAAAEESALNVQKTMAMKVAQGLAAKAKKDPEFLKSYVKHTISPQTTHQHFRLHTRPDSVGGASHHMSDMQDDASKLDNFEHLRVAPHKGESISYRIEGRRKGSDKYEPVLNQGIKKGSGPMKGFAGITKAPFLTKPDEENRAAAIRSSKKPKVTTKEPSTIGSKNFYSDDEMRQKNGKF